MTSLTTKNVDEQLLIVVPEFQEALNEHITEYGELLRYVLWGELTRLAASLYLRSRLNDEQAGATLTRLLTFIEACVQSSDVEVRTLAYYGFLENLHLLGDDLINFRMLLGPHSLEALQKIEDFWGGRS